MTFSGVSGLAGVLTFAVLAAAGSSPAQSRGGAVDAPEMFAELISLVDREHAYAQLRGLDLRAEGERGIDRLGETPGWRDGLLAAQRFVALLGDGHAGVEGWLEQAVPVGSGRLPFLLAEAEGGVVAFKGDRSCFLDEAHPFVETIDGRPVEDWISAASVYVAAGSPQLVRRRSIELIRYVGLVRSEMGLPDGAGVEVELRSADGRRRLSLPLREERELYGTWPRRESGMLPSGFGYLRIERMSLESGAPGRRGVGEQLEPLMNTPGLIIDVRGNGGGDRDLIPFLLARFMSDGEARVVTIAAKRIPSVVNPSHPEGYLQDRGMYPAAWHGWSRAQRDAIERTAGGWKPEWTPPGGWAGRFSDWHYFVVSAGDDDGPDATPRYNGPVVVLMDDGCFSATDILLGGLKGMDRVTLVGLPSGGGSANVEDYRLGTLGPDVSVRLATMASFTPDGRLYDGRGIEPDVVVPRQATDLIGRTDTQLHTAEEVLRRKLDQRR